VWEEAMMVLGVHKCDLPTIITIIDAIAKLKHPPSRELMAMVEGGVVGSTPEPPLYTLNDLLTSLLRLPQYHPSDDLLTYYTDITKSSLRESSATDILRLLTIGRSLDNRGDRMPTNADYWREMEGSLSWEEVVGEIGREECRYVIEASAREKYPLQTYFYHHQYYQYYQYYHHNPMEMVPSSSYQQMSLPYPPPPPPPPLPPVVIEPPPPPPSPPPSPPSSPPPVTLPLYPPQRVSEDQEDGYRATRRRRPKSHSTSGSSTSGGGGSSTTTAPGLTTTTTATSAIPLRNRTTTTTIAPSKPDPVSTTTTTTTTTTPTSATTLPKPYLHIPSIDDLSKMSPSTRSETLRLLEKSWCDGGGGGGVNMSPERLVKTMEVSSSYFTRVRVRVFYFFYLFFFFLEVVVVVVVIS